MTFQTVIKYQFFFEESKVKNEVRSEMITSIFPVFAYFALTVSILKV